MKRIIEWLPPAIKREFWALIVIPLVVTIIPYGIIWTIWPPEGIRASLRDVRFWSMAIIIFTGLLCKAKIGLYALGFLRNRKYEDRVDKFLTVLVYSSFVFLLFCYIPVLLVLLVVAHFASKENVSEFERRTIIGLLVSGVSFTFVLGWYFTSRDQFPLGLAVVLLYCTILMVLIGLAFFSKDKRIGNAKRIIDGAIYILSNVCTFVFGLPLAIRGRIRDWVYVIVSNHEGAFEYIGGIWTSILGWRPSKILAGDNLSDFPIIGEFIGLKTITVKGRRRDKEYKGRLGKILQFVSLVWEKVRSIFTKKKKAKSGSIVNIGVLREIPRNIEKKVIVWIPPRGRERLSDEGVLKKIDPQNLEGIDVLQPIVCLGPLRYKPANKKEKTGKKWYEQQWWVSPRTIRVYILSPMHRLLGETNEQYSERIWRLMTRAKALLVRIIEKEKLYAQLRLALIVALVVGRFKHPRFFFK